MKGIFLFLFLLISCLTFGETTYISIDKLPVNKDNDVHFKFIKDNEKYFIHWSPQWDVSVSKSALVDGLKKALAFYAAQDASNVEINLLLGDVSAYLCNLNEMAYVSSAERYYKKAMQQASLDYRPYWFMAKFYASVNDRVRAIEYFKMAQIRLPKGEPAAFWEQFAVEANKAGMPSTCIHAMDKARSLLARPSDFEKSYGASVRSRISEVSSARTYENNELWTFSEGNKITYTSRPLGMRIHVEPDWEGNISGFERKKAEFSIVPTPVTGTNGQEIKYSISVTAKVATEEEELKAFVNGMIPSNVNKMEIAFSDKYPNTISYELVDSSSSSETGGIHQYLIGVRRKQPLYPGISLEQPYSSSDNSSGETEEPKPQTVRGRFSGVMFYAVKLEATEDIFPTAKRTFWDFFMNQLLLE